MTSSDTDGGRFRDVDSDNVHHDTIEWLAETGITEGVNPPDNDLFDPWAPVTRGQMATFLHRFAAYLTEADEEPTPEPEPPPVVNEEYPANAALFTGGDLRAFVANHKVVDVADGVRLRDMLGGGDAVAGGYVFSRTGNAIFDGEYQVGPFCQPTDGLTLRNLQVRRYLPDGGGVRYDGVKAGAGIINWESSQGCRAIDMTVGFSRMNGYKLGGSGNEIVGGLIHDCHRYAFNGGAGPNIVRDLTAERIAVEATREVSNPHDTIGEWGNRGFCKIAIGNAGWIVEDIDLVDTWNGVWFDIANEPSTIRRIRGTRVSQMLVFIEVSYGSEATGKRWTVEDIEGVDSSNGFKPTTPDAWPIPSLVVSSLTPDIDIRRVRGDGSQSGTVGFIAWNHDQLHNRDSSRMGIDGIVVEDCDIAGTKYAAGWQGDARRFEPDARHAAPTFRNNRYSEGMFRWQGDDLTLDQFLALGHS